MLSFCQETQLYSFVTPLQFSANKAKTVGQKTYTVLYKLYNMQAHTYNIVKFLIF